MMHRRPLKVLLTFIFLYFGSWYLWFIVMQGCCWCFFQLKYMLAVPTFIHTLYISHINQTMCQLFSHISKLHLCFLIAITKVNILKISLFGNCIAAQLLPLEFQCSWTCRKVWIEIELAKLFNKVFLQGCSNIFLLLLWLMSCLCKLVIL